MQRLTQNPFSDVPRADPKTDRRHQRRALTETELRLLLTVARLRPLAEYGRGIVSTDDHAERDPKSRATWKRAPLTVEDIHMAVDRAREALKENPTLIARLERIGHERLLVYKTLLLTGLRKSELASLTVSQLDLDGPVPYVVLNPEDEKNRQGSDIPLRPDLAADLQRWLIDVLSVRQEECRLAGTLLPSRLPASEPLLRVPSGLARILDRDLEAAGIPKRDERNRVVDVHALRHTFGTHLCAAGVPLRTAQAAMRHSKPELTANVYTDPKLLDVAGAIAALPALDLTTAAQVDRVVAVAGCSGTHRNEARAHPSPRLAPALAPTGDLSGPSVSSAGKDRRNGKNAKCAGVNAVSDAPVKRKPPLSTRDNGGQGKRVMGLEPTTFTLAT